MLWRKPIISVVSGIELYLPHSADYAMQKLITASKWKVATKGEKDRKSVRLLLDALIEKSKKSEINKAFNNLTKNEQKIVKKELINIEMSYVIK